MRTVSRFHFVQLLDLDSPVACSTMKVYDSALPHQVELSTSLPCSSIERSNTIANPTSS